jgi:GNAT superfamily N-acetyltransferase
VDGRRYDAGWHEDVTLTDGRRARLRLVNRGDKERLRAGFDALSARSRYLRFFVHKDRLDEAELDYLTDVDQERHVAIGAGLLDAMGEEGEGLGIARFIRLAERPDTAEAAVAVTDSAQRVGLGRLLYQHLAAAAVERGVQRFRCEVLRENEAMRRLIEGAGSEVEVTSEGEVLAIEVRLPPVAAHENLIGRLFRLASEGLLELRGALFGRRAPAAPAPPPVAGEERDG